MAALTQMPRAIAEHEVAHLLGAAIGYIGGDNPRMKHFCEHPRFHDAQAVIGYDASAVQGEFAVVIGKDSPSNGPLTDDQINAIRRSSAIAPIGLLPDQTRILHSVRAAKHWLDLLNDFSGVLSPEDRVIAIKGTPLISTPEQLVGAFAFDAAKAVAPDRLEGIVRLVMKRGGTGGTLYLREFIPRQLANHILQHALKTAKTCFALAHA